MSLSVVAFLVLVVAFAWGSVTAVNAGLIAIVAAYAVGVLLAGLTVAQVTAQFPASLFFVLLGATLLFSIVRVTGTIDLLAAWAERLAQGRRARVPVLMFALTAVLATAGAFTPAAVAIVAPVALALGARFGISALAMGLVIVQGANAGAFSPVNPFGVVANGCWRGRTPRATASPSISTASCSTPSWRPSPTSSCNGGPPAPPGRRRTWRPARPAPRAGPTRRPARPSAWTPSGR
jgi:hypothetical protein